MYHLHIHFNPSRTPAGWPVDATVKKIAEELSSFRPGELRCTITADAAFFANPSYVHGRFVINGADDVPTEEFEDVNGYVKALLSEMEATPFTPAE